MGRSELKSNTFQMISSGGAVVAGVGSRKHADKEQRMDNSRKDTKTFLIFNSSINKKVCSKSCTPEKCAAVHCRDASVVQNPKDAKAGAFLPNKNAPLNSELFTCVAKICYHIFWRKAIGKRRF